MSSLATYDSMNRNLAAQEPALPSGIRVTGIAQLILNPDRTKVALYEGDRHHFLGDVKPDWDAQFWGKAPFQVITVTREHMSQLYFQGTSIPPIQQAEYILKYCISKGWAPKIFFPTAAEAQEAVDTKEYAVKLEDLQAFIEMLADFTERVKDMHYHEIVFGAVEPEPTTVMAIVEQARQRELYEEASLTGDAELLFFTKPWTKRSGDPVCTAVYRSVLDEGVDPLRAFATRGLVQGGVLNSNWQCPLSWYKVIPGINLELAKEEKAHRETLSVKWFPVEIHPLMDKKNVAVMTRYLAEN